jgi:hypothetical protein
MIQCLKCNRVWPTGTVWCGTCKATLGVKLCPDGHINQTVSQCCTICGKSPLSPSAPCRQLGPAFQLAGSFLLLLLFPFGWVTFRELGHALADLVYRLLSQVLFLVIAVCLLGGNSGRRLVTDATKTFFSFLVAKLKLL